MTPMHVLTLFTVATASQIFAIGLEIARVVGLPTTTWRTGDPTLTLYKYLATVLAEFESTSAEFIKAGFLSTATGEWLRVLAWEVYGVEAPEASFAEPTVTVTNAGGGVFPLGPGDVTFRSSVSGKTYHNTNSVTVNGLGDTAIFELVADEAGSDSSVGIDEINEIVTTLLGLEIVSSTAGLANDAATNEEIRIQCRASLGALSPNGPADAYEYVARNAELTGVTGVTRARATNTADGAVTVYVATASGGVGGLALSAIQTAILQWATPLTASAQTLSATTLDIDAAITVARAPGNTASDADIYNAIESALVAHFSGVLIGGDGSGFLSESLLVALVHELYDFSSVTIDSLTDDGLISAGQVPVLAALAVTVE